MQLSESNMKSINTEGALYRLRYSDHNSESGIKRHRMGEEMCKNIKRHNKKHCKCVVWRQFTVQFLILSLYLKVYISMTADRRNIVI